MKKLIILFALVGISMVAKSQGNLQFNKVITLTGNLTATNNSQALSPLQTVPAGKVWKIEHVGFSGSTTCSGSYFGVYINNGISALSRYANTNTLLFHDNICPIWLKEGDNLQFIFFNNCGAAAYSTSYVSSIIEFNVIP